MVLLSVSVRTNLVHGLLSTSSWAIVPWGECASFPATADIVHHRICRGWQSLRSLSIRSRIGQISYTNSMDFTSRLSSSPCKSYYELVIDRFFTASLISSLYT
ncbi:uncharacterized protein BP01DRAFT_232880 [Aspergillus saccharolyticus JOP 1030-1]|uniref:Uncharacterized protein n=1 Tax=Aspergillus saccharolyticus JOP 1030-1 TaxID=1450539 RepID=A0A318YZH4_9EURO|nr:hypothetical protein BP01DRAFT_232880 [Aspergillus saccharolyticus JOP 1030-1]PYH40106.1 hypothetical protein BP01DRAFT_232880 [Aspergillus saccharolyticus JOP 1030-1]